MAINYFAIKSEIDEDDIVSKLTGGMLDFIDALANGEIPSYQLKFKLLIPGAAETASVVYEVIREGDTLYVQVGSIGRKVLVNSIVGFTAGAIASAAAAAIVTLVAPTLIASIGVVVVTAAAAAALDQVITPLVDQLIGGRIENFFEFVTGTFDDQLILLNSAGKGVAEVIYTEGLGSIDPLDAAKALLDNAANLAQIGVPTTKGLIIEWRGDGSANGDGSYNSGPLLKTYSVGDFDPFQAQAAALSGSGLGASSALEVAQWSHARDSAGEAVTNNKIGEAVSGNSELFLAENGAKFAFKAYDGTKFVNLTLDLDHVGTTAVGPVARGGTQLILGSDAPAYTPSTTASKLYFLGGSGFERVTATNGNDILWGGDGDDKLYGNGGDDRIGGGDDQDKIYGGAGEDVLLGGFGDDEIYGGENKDELNGEEGEDKLYGEGGDDILRGGFGDYSDRLEGGKGNDTYYAQNSDVVKDSDGNGVVYFNGIKLTGATRDEPDDDPHNCRDDNDRPNNGGDEDDKYIGDSGEEYIRSGGGLTVTYGGASLTIEGWSDGNLGIKLEDEDKDPTEWSPPDCFASPLVFDLDGDGIELIRLNDSAAYFDIDMDGDAERTAWVAPDDGILAIDLNGNGKIDGAQELFGYGDTYSGGNAFLPGFVNGVRLAGTGSLDILYDSGFAKLATYDLNQDGVINATDTYYNSFSVWRDLDGDGHSDEGELFTLDEVGVASISLTAVQGDRLIEDSLITDTGSYVNSDGATREISDVWFRFNQFDTRYDKSAVTAEIEALPNITGTGGLPDLHVAMAEDSKLKGMVEDLISLQGSDLANFRSAVESTLFRWAKIEDVGAYGRGASANGQRIALIEVVSDTEFSQWSGANPRSTAGQLLDIQYEMILRDMMVRFAASGTLGQDIIPEIAFNNSAFIDLDANTYSTDMLDQIFSTAPTGWAEKFTHIQAGVMMLDRVFMSFTDVKTAADDGAAYKADVAFRLAAAGFADIDYQTLVTANIGSNANDSMISPSLFGFQFYIPTEVALTGAGDDELKWGNKDEVLLWGQGQGNDEVDADVFFAKPSTHIGNIVKLQELTRSDVAISRNDGPIGNDVVITINDTGETLTFRNLLMADNSGRVALEFADGEILKFADLEGVFASFAETGTDGDDTLYQRQGTVLDGGAGDDVLMGGPEATTYIFGRGYGNDEIVDDRGFGPANTLEFGPGITFSDLIFERPNVGNLFSLIITIADTGEKVTILNQFANTRFKIDTFRFADGQDMTVEEILDGMLLDGPGDQRLVGSGRDETFGLDSPGNDTFVGLGGNDHYFFDETSGQDVIEAGGYGHYSPNISVGSYRSLYVEKDRGDLVEFGFRFDELTASRTTIKLFFLHEPSGAQLIVDNTKGHVERYQFADDDYVYTLPEVMDLIDGNIDPQTGSADDEVLTGDNTGNIISGGAGDDIIYGLGGPDTLNGDEGDDTLDAGDRGETPSALRDSNTLNGGTGNDKLLGGWKNDILNGGEGNDRLEGDFGFDTYDGGFGDDIIFSKDGGGVFLWNLGDGNDTILNNDDRFDSSRLQFGAGITPESVTYSIERMDIAGIVDYYPFGDEAWALRIEMPDGSFLRLAGSNYAENFAGMDSIVFSETSETISLDSVIADLYAPSDDDQIFIGTKASDVFAPGGGYDQIFFDRTTGTDTVSIGLGDGENAITGQVDRIAFETEVQVSDIQIERVGSLFEDFLVTLADGTSVKINDAIWARQLQFDGSITMAENLGNLRFGDATVMTVADILAQSAQVSAGDDLTTGDLLANDLLQSAGNDTLRGSGGSDTYHFGAGAGQDTIIETSQGFAYEASDFEMTFFDLSQMREIDTLNFETGLSLSDLKMTRTGDTLQDLRIEIIGTSDQILLKNQFFPEGNWGSINSTGELVTLDKWHEMDELYTEISSGGGPGGPGGAARSWGDDSMFSSGIERFVFGDGSELTRAEFNALVTGADNSGDNVITTGFAGGRLDGGAGNDELNGGAGDDSYVFDAGYDSDVVIDAGGADAIEFGAGLDRGALTLTRTGPDLNDLLIEVGGAQRTALYVEGQFAGDGREIEVFSFADGVSLTAEEIRQSLLSRSISNGHDQIVGFETSDLINARKGDDVIEVRGGNDIVDGGEGFDVVVLRGPQADYVVEIEDDRIVVTDLSGRDGVNRLYNVERLVFADDPITGGATEINLVENQAPDSGTAHFNVDEDGRLSITSVDLLATASDTDGALIQLVSVGSVSNGSLNQKSDGNWVFEPEPDFNGVVTFEYTIKDAGGLSATGTASISVAPVNDAPTRGTQIDDPVLDEDNALTFTIPASAFGDIDGDTLTYTVTLAGGEALPAWLLFDGNTLSGTPPQNFNGYVDLVVIASDGTKNISQDFSLLVVAVNDAPEATGTIAPVEVTEGDVLVLTFGSLGLFTDVDGDEIALSVTLIDGSPLPAWLVYDPQSKSLSGVAPDGTAGALELLVIGSDGQAQATLPLNLTILPDNTAPEVVQVLADVHVDEDQPVDIMLPNGFAIDPDGDTLSYSALQADGSALPSWLAFDPGNLRLAGQPPIDFNGEINVQISISDGELQVTDTFALTIRPVNDAPVSMALSDQEINEDNVVSFSIPDYTFSDVDGDLLTITAQLPDGSELPEWLNFDGQFFSGQPPADFNGAVGVTVIASDGLMETDETFTLTIRPVNDAPVARDDVGFEATGTAPLDIDPNVLLANDSDVDGDTLSVVSVTNGAGGTVSVDQNGMIQFVADNGFSGVAYFNYVTSDGALEAQATVEITVEAGNDHEGWWIGSESRDWMFGPWFCENRIFGAGGNDIIVGGWFDDKLHGGDGRDRIFGGAGDDVIEGNAGNDRLYGSWGDDTISGGKGNDKLWGGKGDDTFDFATGDGHDQIKDFGTGGWGHGWFSSGNDVISLAVQGINEFSDLSAIASDHYNSVVLDFGNGDSLTLRHTQLADLGADDFVFL